MAGESETPGMVLFSTLKKQGAMSYKMTASLVLSGRPLPDGRSPLSRIDDRTWLSRYVVNAPAGTAQPHFFNDFSLSALRIVARLKSPRGKGMTAEEVLTLVTQTAAPAMEQALVAARQDVGPYRNQMSRLLSATDLTVDEQAEAAMVLFLTAGCTADVRRAVEETSSFMRNVHGGGLATPAFALAPQKEVPRRGEASTSLGLLRLVNGYVSGAPQWIAPETGAEIGAFVYGDGAITDVGEDVSGQHARVWCEAGAWFVEGLDSTHGTLVISAADGVQKVVEPPRSARADFQAQPVEIFPGDQLLLGQSTVFLVLENGPQA